MLRVVVFVVLFAGIVSALPSQSVNEIHPERAAQIKEIQSTPGVTWTASAHPRFAAEAPGASKTLLGVKGNWTETIEKAVARGQMVRLLHDSMTEIPESFDSATQWPHCAKIIGDIRDQSNCGCCWAFAGAEAGSDRMCIATKGQLMVPLSAQDVCFNSMKDGCGGGQIDTPWKFLNWHGSVSGGQYKGTGPFGKGLCNDFSLPHCHHHGPQGADPYPAEGKPGCPNEKSPKGPTKCDASAAGEHKDYDTDKYSFNGTIVTAKGEKEIQQAIMSGGPVETAFDVFDDFENYESGIYHHVTGKLGGGHAVKFVGWGVENGVKYWKVANSWNPYWGEKGYFRIKRGNNECNIEAGITGSSPDAKWKKGTNPRPGPDPKDCLDDSIKTKSQCLSPKQYGTCEWCDFGSNVGGCYDKGDKVPGAKCSPTVAWK
jgi:cathepsin B